MISKYIENKYIALCVRIKQIKYELLFKKRREHIKNKRKEIYYVIRRKPPGSGFFSNYLYVLGHIVYGIENHMIPIVDMETYETFYSSPNIKSAWYCFFEKGKNPDIKDIYHMIWIMNVIVLFLFAVDLFGFPNKVTIVWVTAIALYYSMKKECVKIDFKMLILTFGMMLHAIIFKKYMPEYGWNLILSLALVPELCYYLGRQLVGNPETGRKNENKAEIVVIVICVGMFIHAMLNFYMWMQGHDGKLWNDFWPDMLCTISTRHCFLALGVASLIAYAIYMLNKKWYYAVGIILLAAIGNWINILYDNRMVLVITAVILLMNVALYIFLNRKEKKAWYLGIGLLIFSVVLLKIVLSLDIGGIKETQYYYNFINRSGGILKNERMKLHATAASQILTHWKGGGTMEGLGVGGAHNYWLNLANDTGIVTFLLITIFTISALVDTVKLILNPKVSDKIKYLLPSVFMAIFLYHYMENGATNHPGFVLYLTFMAGVIYQVQHCAKEGKQE